MSGARIETRIAERTGTAIPPHQGTSAMAHVTSTLTGYMPIQIAVACFHGCGDRRAAPAPLRHSRRPTRTVTKVLMRPLQRSAMSPALRPVTGV